MAAGGSAHARAAEMSAQAIRLERLAREKRQEAANYRKAAASEAGLAGVLAPLRDRGWVVLEDRRWPGSRRANVDFLLVGPPGVLVLDAKHWHDVRIENGMLYRGQSSEEAQIDKLHRLLDALHATIEDTGLTPANLQAALVFTGCDFRIQVGATWMLGESSVVSWLLKQQARLSAVDVQTIASILDEACPPVSEQPVEKLAVLDIADTESILPTVDELAEAMIAAEMAGPIEDWMIFLHPDQNRLIRSQWNGPARLRGPAGSGKTTVALHRAVYLALRSEHPVLFVTFIRTLPDVMRNLAFRVNRRAASGIEFSGLHQKAGDVLSAVDDRPRLNADAVEGAFSDAWLASPARKDLEKAHRNPRYWRDEIDYVIKGRGLTEFDTYADLQRVGRTTRLQKADREKVWALFESYEEALVRRRTVDFTDLITRAHRAVLDDPELVKYSSVVVDEVQDLSMVGLRFLDALSGDGPNRLLIVGDGQQAIYPGGFTLSEAGVNVVGRANVLDRNYRNTVQILRAADAVVADAEFIDIEGSSESAVATSGIRQGAGPVTCNARSLAEIDAALLEHLRLLNSQHFVAYADTAVLTAARYDAEKLGALLRAHGFRTISLEKYDGTPVDAIKVGTIKRAKGLEFKAVLLPRAHAGRANRAPTETAEGFAERRGIAQRELFVGMTRARDHLWLGSLTSDGAQADPAS